MDMSPGVLLHQHTVVSSKGCQLSQRLVAKYAGNVPNFCASLPVTIETHRLGHMMNQYHMLQTLSHSEAFQRLSQMFFTFWPLLVTSAGHKQKCALALHSRVLHSLIQVSKGMSQHAASGTHNSST